MNIFPDINELRPDIDIVPDPLAAEKNISVSVLRLDKIHPVISGNKLFKLYYYIIQALEESCNKIITFGGAWSNHLAATAAACKQNNIRSIGIVRGEKPFPLSYTLDYCTSQGMELEFISRKEYRSASNKDFRDHLLEKYGPHVLVPAGGYEEKGIKGAELISNFFKPHNYDFVCCAAGTGATVCGLSRSLPATEFLAFNVLKNPELEKQISVFAGSNSNFSVIDDYTFGGFAKKNNELTNFMNELYQRSGIPTDFVYTGKMIFGLFDLIRKNKFKEGTRILSVHTGGLQGNLSLPPGLLNF